MSLQDYKLQEEIQAAITTNLPAQVGDALKTQLARLEVLEKQTREQTKQAATNLASIESLSDSQGKVQARINHLETQEEGVLQREKAIAARETECALHLELNVLRQKHADERVAELRGVVLGVFRNNQFKYTTGRTGPVVLPSTPGVAGSNEYSSTQVHPMGPSVEQHPSSESVEGEGGPG